MQHAPGSAKVGKAPVHIAGVLILLAYGTLAWSSHRMEHRSLLATLWACLAIAWVITLALSYLAHISAGRVSLGWVCFYGVLFRVVGFLGEPVFEDDFHRFLWDGQVFARNGTPYGVVPADFFADSNLDERFEIILNQVSFPHLPTPYGPVCELAFLAGYLIAPGSLAALKLILILAEVGAFAVMRRWLDPRAAVLWFWCPLLIQETAFSAHPDALGLAAAAAAWSAHRGQRAVLCGFLLGLAVGARPFAALLAPFLPGGNGRRMGISFVLTTLALHLPFLVGTGGPMAGLGAFAAGWEFNSSGFAVLQAMLGTTPAKGVGALLFAIAYGLCVTHGRRAASPASWVPGDWVFGALFLFSPVVNPWYLQWLVPFVALRPRAWSVVLLAMVPLSYATNQNLGLDSMAAFNHPVWVRPLEFGMVALAGLAPWLRKRWAVGQGIQEHKADG